MLEFLAKSFGYFASALLKEKISFKQKLKLKSGSWDYAADLG